MAIFNPQIQEQGPPSYLGLAQPISPIEGDKSKGMMLQGAGNVLKAAVTGIDEIFKSVIDSGLRKDLETERDATTGALETMAGLPADQRVSPIQPDLDVLKESSQRPAGLDGLDRAVTGAVNGAKAKPSMTTYYMGKLDTIAKDYRSQYPGYADYIDQRVASITGVNPANERLKDLMTMIQQNATGTKADTDKALSFMHSNMGHPDSQLIVQAIASGQVSNPHAYAMNAVAKWKQLEYKVEQAGKLNGLEKSNNEVRAARFERDAVSIGEDTSRAFWTTMKSGIEIKDGVMGTPDKFAELSRDVALGKAKLDSTQGQAYGQAMMAMGRAVEQKVMDYYNQENKEGWSIAKGLADPKKVRDYAKAAAQRYYEIGDQFLNEKHGVAFENVRATEAHIADAGNYLFTKSAIKEHVALNSVITKYAGPAAGGIMSAELLKSDKIDNMVQQFTDYQVKRMAAINSVVSMETVIKDLKEKKIGMDPNRPGERSVYTFLTKDLPQKLADTRLDPSMRQQLSMNLFSGDVMSQFEVDRVDEKGNFIPGRHAIFRDMTDSKVKDAVWNLAGGNKENAVWLGYKSWVAKQNNILMNGAVKELNELQKYPFSDIRDDRSQSYVKFAWDNKNHQLSYENKDPRQGQGQVPLWPGDGGRTISKMEIPKNVAFINSSLRPIIEIAQKEGGDPNAAVLKHLNNLGFKPNGTGVESEIMRSVAGPEPVKKGETSNTPKIDTPTIVNNAFKDLAKGAAEFAKRQAGSVNVPPKSMYESTDPMSVPFAPEPDPNDATLNSVQSFVANPIRAPSKKKSKNLSSEDLLSMSIEEIPEGMSARDFIKSMRK
jgi:hypothetical protein